jgi:hypothetical protein
MSIIIKIPNWNLREHQILCCISFKNQLISFDSDVVTSDKLNLQSRKNKKNERKTKS